MNPEILHRLPMCEIADEALRMRRLMSERLKLTSPLYWTPEFGANTRRSPLSGLGNRKIG